MATSKFTFYPMGIGQLLRQGRLEVPPNQRSYAWKEKHVRNFLEDLNEAISGSATTDDYFLGTIVLIQKTSGLPTIVDGQQRLATTAILLARIRDHFISLSREGSARSIEEAFLGHTDLTSETPVSRIKLNDDDNEYFNKVILPRPSSKPEKESKGARMSNRRLYRASQLARDYIVDLLKPGPAERAADKLVKWVEFIDTKASILAVYVPDEVSAFRMFETLNDRGLRASQADILKNYFFSRVPNRLSEAKTMWNTMVVTIEPTATERDEDDDEETNRNDPLVTYIRHLWVTTHGPTKERELAAQIRLDTTTEPKTMAFLTEASEAAQDYVALSSSKHPKWAKYKSTTRHHIDTIADYLHVKQIRPLLFAVARHFTPAEADKAFKLFVSWSVRFLIFGGRGGMLDNQYSLRAKEVGTKKIARARELREAMKKYVPTDAEFEEAFATARVSRTHLARYYLRAIEKTIKGLDQPEYVPNEDVADINLEHVMPIEPSKDWVIDDEIAQAGQKFLGNMVLIKAKDNVSLGNASFAKKREVYKKSGYILTKEAGAFNVWTLNEIRQQQKRMAKVAVKTWSLDFAD